MLRPAAPSSSASMIAAPVSAGAPSIWRAAPPRRAGYARSARCRWWSSTDEIAAFPAGPRLAGNGAAHAGRLKKGPTKDHLPTLPRRELCRQPNERWLGGLMQRISTLALSLAAALAMTPAARAQAPGLSGVKIGILNDQSR